MSLNKMLILSWQHERCNSATARSLFRLHSMHIFQDGQTKEEEQVFAALKRRTTETEESRPPPKEAARPESRQPRTPSTPINFNKALDEFMTRFRETLRYLAAK